MRFIRCIDQNDNWVIIAVSSIQIITQTNEDEFTRIYISSDDFVAVKETPTDIYNKLI